MPQATNVSSSNIMYAPTTPDGYQTGVAATSLEGFFGATPVVQPSSAGNVTTVAAGSTTTAFVNTTFSGGVGSTAYTIGDIVLALKKLGLIAS